MEAKSKSTLSSIVSREFFKEKFAVALEEWQKKTGKTQAQLAEMIPVSGNMVSRYKNGLVIPSNAVFDRIAEIFAEEGVMIGGYNPETRADKYKFDSDYMDEVGKEHSEYCEAIGVKRSFLQLLHEITDMDSLFPLYSPIEYHMNIEVDEYFRLPLKRFADSAKMTKDSRFQIHRGGKTITLHRADLHWIKELQDEVQLFIEYLYLRREREMEEEVEEVNRRYKWIESGGIWYAPQISESELKEIDRFRKYCVAEKNNGNNT